MIEITGPGQCTQGVLCQIFYHLRTQISFVHLTGNGREIHVKTREILLGTLEYTRMPVFQRLMSLVASMTEVYVGSSDDSMKQPRSLEPCNLIDAEVNNLWTEYAGGSVHSGTQLSWKDTKTGHKHYRDAFTALTVAYFATVRILIQNVQPQIYDTNSNTSDHYATVMETSQYLQTQTIGCAYMRMATPLLLVALHSPSPDQRKKALECFQSWTNGAMKGISLLALDTIYQH